MKSNIDHVISSLISESTLDNFYQKISSSASNQLKSMLAINGFSEEAPQEMHQLQDYVFEGEFGAGSFGRILKAKNVSDLETTFAIKIIDLLENPQNNDGKRIATKLTGSYANNIEKVQENIYSTYHDVIIPATFPHPNIVKIFRVFFKDGFLFIVMEAISHGCVLQNEMMIPCITEDIIRAVMVQVFTAVQFLHSNKVMHRDLHAGNIMLSYDPETSFTTVKLIDFGQARIIDKENDPITSVSCAKNHSPPECLMEPKAIRPAQDSSFDIWCLGTLIYDYATVKFQGFYSGNVPPYNPQQMSEQLFDVIRACCEENPIDRPSISDLEEFTFFQNHEIDEIIHSGRYKALFGSNWSKRSPCRQVLSTTPLKQSRRISPSKASLIAPASPFMATAPCTPDKGKIGEPTNKFELLATRRRLLEAISDDSPIICKRQPPPTLNHQVTPPIMPMNLRKFSGNGRNVHVSPCELTFGLDRGNDVEYYGSHRCNNNSNVTFSDDYNNNLQYGDSSNETCMRNQKPESSADHLASPCPVTPREHFCSVDAFVTPCTPPYNKSPEIYAGLKSTNFSTKFIPSTTHSGALVYQRPIPSPTEVGSLKRKYRNNELTTPPKFPRILKLKRQNTGEKYPQPGCLSHTPFTPGSNSSEISVTISHPSQEESF